MNAPAAGPPGRAKVRPVRMPGRIWRRILWVTIAAAGLAALLAWSLFSGSVAGCERAGMEAAPELRCAFEVAAPRQEVWTAFVETEVPRSYYFDTVLQAELEAGGRWRFVTEDRGRLLASGEIVELEPPARLELTFSAADLDGGILAAIDGDDGERAWKGGRYGHGQLVLLPEQDLLLVLSEEGELALVPATPDGFTELARRSVLEGKTWNHPVVVG